MRTERLAEEETADLDGAQLSAAAARGDRAAFEQLHARFAPGIRRLFLKRTGGDGESAGELAQQVWADVWRGVQSGRYDPQRAAISTYAYAVANHVWMRYCRANARMKVVEVRESAASAGPESVLRHAELLDALRGCLEQTDGPNALTDEERELVTAMARGASERELAGQLRLAASTVHARKQGAYTKLRRCLAMKGYARDEIEQSELFGE